MTDALHPFRTPIPEVEEDRVAEVLAESFGLSGRLTALPGERDRNFRLDSDEGAYVVKVANPGEDTAAVDLQQAALEHLERVGCRVPTPHVVRTSAGPAVVAISIDGVATTLRVQTHLDGALLGDNPAPRRIGAVAAELQHGLQGFFHPAAGRSLLWDVRSLPALSPLLESVADGGLRTIIGPVLERVEREVLPRLPALPGQVIHGDLNPANLLVDREREIAGVIDFGDMVHAPRVCDLGIAGAYQVSHGDTVAGPLGEMITGYLEHSDLTPTELSLLTDLVAARLCQSIVIAHWRARLHPDNTDYILGDAAGAARALNQLEGEDAAALSRRLLRVAGLGKPSQSNLARRREELLGPLRLMYAEPLSLVSGEGVWLFDEQGERYLDAYNNVVQLGHGHPAVVAAVRRQMAALNTNTRYLTVPPVEFAERLTDLLPAGLDVCYFTNSGSEANDLAMRIARTVTSREGMIVTDHAYHGTTALTAAMSPEEAKGPLAPWVATVAPPPAAGPAAEVERATDRLAESGHQPAALVYDTIFSSDGIHDPLGPFLDESMEAIRTAGGLFIADEVQAGLGRVGERLWGFAAATGIPDIVTLGKPIGNGYPIGAVVTSREFAEAFAGHEHFFSTFGGSTVSAAAGCAVIDATLSLGLPERAERVGAYLRARLEQLLAGSGRVRGAGLFVGVELEDAKRAEAAVERMKAQRVLIGRTGPGGNVLKIRPPLVFTEEHADMVCAALAEAL